MGRRVGTVLSTVSGDSGFEEEASESADQRCTIPVGLSWAEELSPTL